MNSLLTEEQRINHNETKKWLLTLRASQVYLEKMHKSFIKDYTELVLRKSKIAEEDICMKYLNDAKTQRKKLVELKKVTKAEIRKTENDVKDMLRRTRALNKEVSIVVDQDMDMALTLLIKYMDTNIKM